VNGRVDGGPDRPPAVRSQKACFGSFWEAVGRQLRRPSGVAGATLGRLMAIINRRPYRLTLEALQLEPRDEVLEIGFGSGRGLHLLGRRVHGRIVGVDHSEAMVVQARRKNRQAIASGHLELVLGAFGALPLGDASFDKILLVNVAYFFDRRGRDISEVHRVLRPGGRIAVYATEKSTMERWPFSGPKTHRTFDASELTTLLEEGGFDRSLIWTRTVRLPFRMQGIVAHADKRDSGGLERAGPAPLPVR